MSHGSCRRRPNLQQVGDLHLESNKVLFEDASLNGVSKWTIQASAHQRHYPPNEALPPIALTPSGIEATGLQSQFSPIVKLGDYVPHKPPSLLRVVSKPLVAAQRTLHSEQLLSKLLSRKNIAARIEHASKTWPSCQQRCGDGWPRGCHRRIARKGEPPIQPHA